jgi:hypothetical protein
LTLLLNGLVALLALEKRLEVAFPFSIWLGNG